MTRRELLSFLGIGAAAAVVAPKMLAQDNGMYGEPINTDSFIYLHTGDNPTCGLVKSYIWKNPYDLM